MRSTMSVVAIKKEMRDKYQLLFLDWQTAREAYEKFDKISDGCPNFWPLLYETRGSETVRLLIRAIMDYKKLRPNMTIEMDRETAVMFLELCNNSLTMLAGDIGIRQREILGNIKSCYPALAMQYCPLYGALPQ